jgi:hypothetical protein
LNGDEALVNDGEKICSLWVDFRVKQKDGSYQLVFGSEGI